MERMMEEFAYVVNVDGVVVRDEQYLLIERGADEEHASGILGFPGGKIEHPAGHESVIEETAVRELDEEVGVEIGAVEYIHSTTFEADDGTECINIIALCEYLSGDAYPRATDEVAAVHWLSFNEIQARADIPPFIKQHADRVEEHRAEG